MESLDFESIAAAVGGRLINCADPKAEINGITTDSRKINKGEMFIALRGENMDGHDYVEKAFEKGAGLALICKSIDTDYPCIIVEDTYTALKKLAKYYRNMFDIPVIAVTGSTGKTSTKEIISCVLGEKFRVHKTQKNFNNEIGLPLTIFNLDKNHQVSVIEMGMNSLGEIERLADIAKPSAGVITNVGTAHIERLGSRENILKAKMEITSYFSENSILFINGDDEYLSSISDRKYKIISVSLKGKGDYNAVNIVDYGEAGVEFQCSLKGNVSTFRLYVPGIHNVYNALFAVAIGDMFNMDMELVKVGISDFRPVGQRMNIINLEGNIKIINDCYNANIDSMRAALDVINSFKEYRRIAVLGDMFELGNFSEEAHRIVGRYAADNCNILVAVGNDANYIYEEASKKIKSLYFKTKEEACLYLNNMIQNGDVILIKGSRGMKMEDITEHLLEDRKKGI